MDFFWFVSVSRDVSVTLSETIVSTPLVGENPGTWILHFVQDDGTWWIFLWFILFIW